jgi:hypothetical protein
MIMRKILTILCLFFAGALAASAQQPVLMPVGTLVPFTTAQGAVCSACTLYTYTSGTNTPLATYTDYTGTVPNTNPIVLNAAGYAENSVGSQVGIWLSASATYRFVLKNAASVQLYQVDGISGQLPATITGAITILNSTCNQITVGIVGFQTGLCFPSPTGNITLTFPNTADTMVGRATTDTMTNKTLTSPILNTAQDNNPTEVDPTVNGALEANQPGTYLLLANASPGTTLSTLSKLANAPSQVTIAATSDTSGDIGICVSNCGTTGNAVIQASGTGATCIFDGAVTANDYVVVSTTTAGECHDAGSSYPTLTQVIGRVLVTNAAAGTYAVLLYGSDVKVPGSIAGITMSIANAGTTGTTQYALAKLTGAPSTAVIPATTDIGGIVGITIAGAGTTGSATVQQNGLTSCIFDGATTANDYISISTTTAGDCHDAGAAPGGLGRVLSTNATGGTYAIVLELGAGGKGEITQWQSAAGCNSSGSACTVTVIWPQPFVDTSYIAICTGVGPVTGNPQPAFLYVNAAPSAAASITVAIDNRGTTNPGGFTTIYCEGHHN